MAELGRVPIIAVGSGKGGVGKTTVAVNLALALGARGMNVGLVDADLYGPDVPRMMGLRRRADTSAITVFAAQGSPGARLEPVRRHGVQLVSAAFLLGESQAFSAGGSLAQLMARRLLVDTAWEDLGCLVVDLPPGTADIQQFVFGLRGRRAFVLLVLTPQVIAHQDVRRLIADLARYRAVPLGGVENMSGLLCPRCGETTALFPSAAGEDSVWTEIPKLASIPFSPQAASDADQGRPVLVTRAIPEHVAAYERLAAEVARRLDEDQGAA
ncbi:MAG TPA: P-loop NTPase [Streptosporangiaceae bacterium]